MGKRRSNSQDPSSNSTKYTGAIVIRPKVGEVTVATTNLTLVTTFTTNGSGDAFAVYSTDQVTSVPEWSTWASLYREYRVLGMEATYMPRATAEYPATGVQIGYGATYIQHGTSGAVSSTTAAVENATYQPWSVGKWARRTWHMTSVDEANFITTATYANFGGVGFCAEAAQASSAFGTVYVRYLVQFRGRA